MRIGKSEAFAVVCLISHVSGWTPWNEMKLSSRRDVFQSVATGTAAAAASLFFPCERAWAALEDESSLKAEAPVIKKPFAPVELLLPAARVKWTIDRANQLATASNPDWSQLRSLLLLPQNYTNQQFAQVPTAPAKAYLDTYQRNREQLNILAQPGALLVQSGEIAAWKRLKRQERTLEQQDEIRAAFNLYTGALNYNAESYVLNVPAAERKQMIRQDRLPDIKQVIQSDMGMRYLIRNDLLTTMEEVKAELQFQLEQKEQGAPSKEELVALLQKAQAACNQWFSLIEEQDVQEAMEIVKNEKDA